MEQTLADSERVLGPDNPQTLAFKKHVEGMIREPPYALPRHLPQIPACRYAEPSDLCPTTST